MQRFGSFGFEIFAGQVIPGACVSLIVTVNEQVVDWLPLVSVALHVTEVVPFGNTVPDAGVQPAVTPGQLTAAAAEKVTTAEH